MSKKNGGYKPKSQSKSYAKDEKKGSQYKEPEAKGISDKVTGISTYGTKIKKGKNDPSWYMTNPVIKTQIASYPFGYPTGSAISLAGIAGSDAYSMPGIMRINYTPTYGGGDSNVDPINIAAKNLYTYINSRNSRNPSYDANDLMLYIVCVDSAITYHSFMKRLYGCLNLTDIQNRFLPKGIVEAAGGNYEDLTRHIKDFQAYINQYAMNIRTLVLPNEMSLTQRHRYLTEGFYVDTDSKKSQMYVFVPDKYYTFDLDSSSAGIAKGNNLFTNIGTGTRSFNDLVEIGNNILDGIRYRWGEADFNTISADLLKAFGDDRVYNVDYINDDYTTWAIDDPWMHGQIQNLTCFGPLTACQIRQSDDKNYLITDYSITKTFDFNDQFIKNLNMTGYYASDRILNSYSDSVSEDEVLELTRLLNIPSTSYVTSTDNKGVVQMDFDNCASEIATSIYLYEINAGSMEIAGPYITHTLNLQVTHPDASAQLYKDYTDMFERCHTYFNQAANLSQFRYHPYTTLYSAYTVNSSEQNVIKSFVNVVPLGDTQNFAKITWRDISMMNTNIMFHMYALTDK